MAILTRQTAERIISAKISLAKPQSPAEKHTSNLVKSGSHHLWIPSLNHRFFRRKKGLKAFLTRQVAQDRFVPVKEQSEFNLSTLHRKFSQQSHCGNHHFPVHLSFPRNNGLHRTPTCVNNALLEDSQALGQGQPEPESWRGTAFPWWGSVYWPAQQGLLL